MSQTLRIHHFSAYQPYEPVWRAMQAFTAQRTDKTDDAVWLLQHESVYTTGQAGDARHLLHHTDIPLYQTDRGGQITWHGPGQLMCYTLLDTRRLGLQPRVLVQHLERAIVTTLTALGIPSTGDATAPGVYVTQHLQRAKIAAIGLRWRQRGCYHGAALNLDCDLSAFRHINPCGQAGQTVTRIADLVTPNTWSVRDTGIRVTQALAQQLGYACTITEHHDTLMTTA